DSALRFFRQAEKILPLRNASDSDLLGSIRDNIAQNYLRRNNIDTALILYRANVSLYSTLHNDEKILQAETGILNCFIALKNFNAASLQLKKIEKLWSGTPSLHRPETHLQVLSAFQSYYYAMGDWRQALHFREQYDSLNDSVIGTSRATIDN